MRGGGMNPSLDHALEKLGGGEVIQIESGETIFKLDSSWYEDSELTIGAVFNGGAEVFQDKVILMPRCHQGYQKGTFFDETLGIERYYLENYISEVWPLVSEYGIHFTRLQNVIIRGDDTDHQDFTYGIEDIRIIKLEDRYLLVGCGKVSPPFRGKDADRIQG
jgi:predicted GH43/DUF377 family glycosyl hydrolase